MTNRYTANITAYNGEQWEVTFYDGDTEIGKVTLDSEAKAFLMVLTFRGFNRYHD